MIYYAIEHITTGNLLPPGGKSLRGHTHQEATSSRPPRLFKDKKIANRAMKAYVQGKWKNSYNTNYDGESDYSGPEPDWRTKRSPEEYKVVKIQLTKRK